VHGIGFLGASECALAEVADAAAFEGAGGLVEFEFEEDSASTV